MRELDPDVTERNYAKEPLTRKELQALVAAAPSVEALLNTRNKDVRERGWKQKPPSKAAFVTAVLEDNNLIRRPLLLAEGELAVGMDEDAIRALLG